MPLALVVYRFIQLGSKTIVHLVEATFLAPLCVAILYALHLAHAHVRFHWPKMIQFHQWFNFAKDKEEEEEDNVMDSQCEYDPISLIKAQNLMYKTMI